MSDGWNAALSQPVALYDRILDSCTCIAAVKSWWRALQIVQAEEVQQQNGIVGQAGEASQGRKLCNLCKPVQSI